MENNTTPVPYTQTPWETQTMGQDVWIDTPVDHNGGIRKDIGRLTFRGDDPVTKSNARIITAAVNSYAKHCGPNAIQCAEDDLLGQALEALRICVLDIEYRNQKISEGQPDPGEGPHGYSLATNVLSQLAPGHKARPVHS